MALQDDMVLFYGSTGKKLNKAMTGFNELSVASGYPLIDLKSVYGISVLRDRTTVTGSGEVTNNNIEYTVKSGTTAGSTAVLASAELGRYIAGFEAVPGVGLRIPTLPIGDQDIKWGYFDDDTGFGTGVDATGIYTFCRKSGVDTIRRPSDWTGPILSTGIDLSKVTIFRYPFRWYGSGPIVFEVSDISDRNTPGLDVYDVISSDDAEPIISDPNLPLRVVVDNGTTSSNIEAKVSGRQFNILGEYAPSKRVSSESRESVSVADTGFIPIISWQQKEAFKSISCLLNTIQVLAATNDVHIQIRLDGTLTGESFGTPSDIPASETALQYDTSASAISGGYKLYETFVAAGTGPRTQSQTTGLPNVNIPYDGIITLCAKGIGGTSTIRAVLTAEEEW